MSRIRLSADAERHLRETARQRCGYCLSPQRLVFALHLSDDPIALEASNKSPVCTSKIG